MTRYADVQKPFDVAVVIPTVLRSTLPRAVQSVFDQDLDARIQIMIGIDQRQGDQECLHSLVRECPDNICLTILDLGYSTSRRHGGIYANHYSGALRTILSYAANSKYVAYLDDDDWWGRGHLSGLMSVIAGKDWAFSYRWLVDQGTGWPICRDEWDSVGPGRGINQERFGGFVSPSNLLLDKEACHFVLPYWSLSPFTDGSGEDRLVFKALLQRTSWATSGKYSCYYEMSRDVQRHAHHMREFTARHIGWIYEHGQIDEIVRLADDAAKALDKGANGDAIVACRRALAMNLHHAWSLMTLALAEWRAGYKSKALSHITQAFEVYDRDPAIVATWAEMNGESTDPVTDDAGIGASHATAARESANQPALA